MTIGIPVIDAHAHMAADEAPAQALLAELDVRVLNISLGLDNKTRAEYSIKLSFPTREKSFWLKLMNLRIGNDPPEAAILSMRLVCHFARPRALERGAARPFSICVHSANRCKIQALVFGAGGRHEQGRRGTALSSRVRRRNSWRGLGDRSRDWRQT